MNVSQLHTYVRDVSGLLFGFEGSSSLELGVLFFLLIGDVYRSDLSHT